MANINARLPSTLAAPFHPPTENLQHDNSIKPIIPKTEIISSYHKTRDEQGRNQFSTQARDIIQNENKPSADENSQHESSAQQSRTLFFARRRKELAAKPNSVEIQLAGVNDYAEVISVIQARYQKAVSPWPEPSVFCAV